MAKLVLDPLCVLSAWEQIGGNAFSSDDVLLDDPAAFNLDLSSWEARLKSVTAPPAPTPLESNFFASIFAPAEMAFGFMASCVPTGGTTPGATFSDSGAQVVPHYPASSGGGGSLDDCCTGGAAAQTLTDGGLFGADANQIDDDGVMSLQFSDMEPAVMSTSPISSEAGVVPDFQGSPNLSQVQTLGSTASSQLGRQPRDSMAAGAASAGVPGGSAPGCMTALAPPVLCLPGSFFVPVGGADALVSGMGCTLPLGSTRWCSQGSLSTGGCGAQACKREDVAQTDTTDSSMGMQAQPMSCLAGGCQATQQAMKQEPALPAPSPPPQQSRAQGGSIASVSAAPAGQTAQGCNVPYTRTRAECLERYRQKKARRLYTKKIRYQLRKINADKRPRIKGRFVKKEELEEFMAAKRGGSRAGLHEDPYFGDGMQESDEE